MRRLAILSALMLVSTAAAVQPQVPSVGQIAFANSGSAQAQDAFLRGIALLHNFEYPRAAAAFADAQKADPDFALAYWGEAMTHNHPIWLEQDFEKGRAALARLAPTREGRLAKAGTERERAYLEAAEILYGEGSKEARDFAYSVAMERLFKTYPQDVDAGAFYALSLLGLAHEGRDFGLYMRAAAVLEELFPANQSHPGVLHYLIHSYDDPTHAPLGLRAARLYGAVAPDAPHALHMTSHIFIAMGDWEQTIAANEAARAASIRIRGTSGRAPAACGHGLEWLNYSYYQVGQPERSEAIRQACHGGAIAELAGERREPWSDARSYADMWVRAIVEGGLGQSEQALSVDHSKYPDTAFTLAYGSLLLARGKPAAIASAQGRMKQAAAASNRDNVGHPLILKRQEVALKQAEGLHALALGRREEGLRELRKAAELEQIMAPDFGPPMVEKPSFELLGEELLAAGLRREAAEAFRHALKLAPGRRISSVQLAKLDANRPDGSRSAAAAPHTH